MTQIGLMSDSHNNETGPLGARSRLSTDMVTLVETVGVEDIYWHGDQVHPDGKARRPHFAADYDAAFWDYVKDSGYYDRVGGVLPGNHDVPVQHFLESDPKAKDRFTKRYDDGLTVIGLNTSKTGYMTGAPGNPPGGNAGGQGPNTARLAYTDLWWLDAQLDAAPATDTKLVVCHHAPYFSPNASLDHPNLVIEHTSYSPDATFRMYNSYDVVQNYKHAHQVLSKYNRVVVVYGHLFQFSVEGSDTVDGVTYCYKKHYYEHSGDNVHTFAHVNATSTGATVTTREHSDGTETTILNKTW